MENVSFLDIIINLIRCLFYANQSRRCLCIFMILSILCGFVLPSEIEINSYFEIMFTSAGFCLAALSIIMSGNAKEKMKQQIESNDHCECMSNCYKGLSNSKIIDDLSATLGFGIIVSLLGILAYFFRNIFPEMSLHVKTFFLCFTILWDLHITLHIFSLRSII